ncbi:LuxR C-terminal-related transcriptional regulator [Streptomyces sp. NPDC002537]
MTTAPPFTRLAPVPRPRLRRLFTAHVSAARVVLVTAPTGSGKTTALADWASWNNQENGHNTAWISLDGSERDSARLLARMVNVLSAAAPVAGTAELLAGSAGKEWRDLLPEVLAWLKRLPQPVTLVIDRLHRVRAAEVHQLLAQLVRHACPFLQLVFATQTRRHLPWLSPRSGGDILAVPAQKLLFTRSEIEALCSERGIEASGSLVESLLKATGGWAHSLAEVVNGLANGSPADLPSLLVRAHQEAASLLAREAAVHESDRDWLALLKLSVVEDPLVAGLPTLITGRSDAGGVLHRCADASGLVTSHEDGYRFLPGIAAPMRVLLHERLGAELVERAHLAAMDWHRDHGSPARAVDHALSGRDFTRAWTLLRDTAVLLCLSGEGKSVLRLLGRFHTTQDTPPRPEADALYALALTVLGRFEDGAAVLERAEQGLAEESPRPSRTWVEWAIAIVHLMQCHQDGDLGAATHSSETVRKVLAKADSRLWAGSAREHETLLAPYLALTDWWQGDGDRARRQLNASRLDAELHGRTAQASGYAALSSLLSYLDGYAAQPDPLASLSGDGVSGTLRELYNSFVSICDGRRAWERGDLQTLEQALDRFGHAPTALRALCATETDLLQAELHLARKNAWAAQRAVTAVETRQRIGDPPGWRARAVYTGVRVRLALGRTNDAAALLRRGSAELQHPYGRLAAAHVKLATGTCPSDALALLEPLRNGGQWRSTFKAEAWLLSALAWQQSGRPGMRVRQALRQAASLAHHEGMVRIFQEQAPWCRPLLVACAADTGDPDGHVTSLLKVLSADVDPGTQLSRREREVVALLVGDLTLIEIAERLCVSVNTVKTQVRSVYRKLGVSKRREAVAEARARGLLG